MWCDEDTFHFSKYSNPLLATSSIFTSGRNWHALSQLTLEYLSWTVSTLRSVSGHQWLASLKSFLPTIWQLWKFSFGFKNFKNLWTIFEINNSLFEINLSSLEYRNIFLNNFLWLKCKKMSRFIEKGKKTTEKNFKTLINFNNKKIVI